MVNRKRLSQKKEKDLAKQVQELKSLIRKSKRNVDSERKKICRDLEALCKKLCKKHKKSDPPDPPWHYGPACPHR
jgi:uncharacterized protein YlxW (UPF0749 family)